MIKSDELVSGCIAKAADNEPVFVLRAQDKLAPMLVKLWADLAESRGAPAKKVADARFLAEMMHHWPKRKYPD